MNMVNSQLVALKLNKVSFCCCSWKTKKKISEIHKKKKKTFPSQIPLTNEVINILYKYFFLFGNYHHLYSWRK